MDQHPNRHLLLSPAERAGFYSSNRTSPRLRDERAWVPGDMTVEAKLPSGAMPAKTELLAILMLGVAGADVFKQVSKLVNMKPLTHHESTPQGGGAAESRAANWHSVGGSHAQAPSFCIDTFLL